MKQFKFIDGTKSDKSTRRSALSHAMKGKNVGRTHKRHRRSSHHHRQSTTTPAAIPKSFNVGSRDEGDREMEEEIIASSLSVVCYSLPSLLGLMDTTMKSKGSLDVIKNYFTSVVEVVYPPFLCLSLEHIKAYWMRMMFIDTTSYHCSLALMATLNSFVFSAAAGQGQEVNEPPEAYHHLSQAVRLVNQKLSTAEALSASNLSVVNFLIVREMFRGERKSAEIHLAGLRKMVELRGGLERLEGEDRTLVLKICKTDIDYALHCGTPTAFYRDRMSDFFVRNTLNTTLSPAQPLEISSFLQKILLDANTLAHWINTDNKSPTADNDPHMLQEVIVSLGYRLIRFRALHSDAQVENVVEASIHIGLIAFLTTLFLQFSGRRFLRYGLVAECLKDVADDGWGTSGKGQMECVLWLLFISGISVMQETATDRSWSVLHLQHLVKSMGMESWTWTQVRHLLGQFAWIGRIHDRPGQDLWEEITSQAGLEVTLKHWAVSQS